MSHREVIQKALNAAYDNGLPLSRGCRILGLNVRTVQRWKHPKESRREDHPVPRPHNALMPIEIDKVHHMIRCREYSDFSVRELCIAALEKYRVYVSPVTFWAYQKKLRCNGPRRGKCQGKGHGNKPDVSWVTGPNQLWAWDITHLPTERPYEFYYLYVLEDVFDRKVVSWVITENLRSEAAQELWDQGLENEGLWMKDSSEWPKSLSDRGTQMRSKSTKRFFQNRGVAQLFSRPRTPDDNPKIEALFSTAKSEPEYPGYFSTTAEAVDYFTEFFRWYNEEHLHTSLRMLTPSQVHSGKGEEILATRRAIRDQTIEARRDYFKTGNQNQSNMVEIAFSKRRNTQIRFKYSGRESALDNALKSRQALLN